MILELTIQTLSLVNSCGSHHYSANALVLLIKLFLYKLHLTLYLLALSTDDCCKQPGPRSGPTKCLA